MSTDDAQLLLTVAATVLVVLLFFVGALYGAWTLLVTLSRWADSPVRLPQGEPQAPPPLTPRAKALAAFADARGYRNVRPLAIEGEVRGVRFAVEATEDAEPRFYVDTVIVRGDPGLVAKIAGQTAGIPRASVALLGRIARVEWPASALLDEEPLDAAIGALVDACATPGDGAYR